MPPASDRRVALQIQLPYNLQNGSPIVSLDGVSEKMSTYIHGVFLARHDEKNYDNFCTCVVSSSKTDSWVTLPQIKSLGRNAATRMFCGGVVA